MHAHFLRKFARSEKQALYVQRVFFTISQDKVEIKIFLNWTVTIEIVLISVFP